MAKQSRREFLSDAALLTLAGAMLAKGEVLGEDPKPAVKKASPNEQVRIAVIGVNGRGKDHIKGFAKLPNANVVAICDVDERLKKGAVNLVNERQGTTPIFETDLRRILDNKQIDAISVATPNHWHTLASIWALQAGKDVYVEKPMSHNVWEGRQLIRWTEKTGRIVQVGTQSRSNPGMQQAIEFIRAGKIGKVRLARGLCYKLRPPIGSKVQTPVPKGMHYDTWLGPAPLASIERLRMHYDWHWFWDYGNGDLGNQGVHEMDKARWGLGVTGHPIQIMSIGGRVGYEDCAQTANTQICIFDYGDKQIQFEVRGLPSKDYKGAKVGNIWYGSNGYVVAPSYSKAAAFSPKGEKIAEFKGDGDHFANFIAAVRSRKAETLAANVNEGHLSAALCHLANISYRVGTLQKALEVPTTAWKETARDAYLRMLEHLTLNKLPSDKLKLRVGPALAFDPIREQFTNHSPANLLLTRNYRKGFQLPPV